MKLVHVSDTHGFHDELTIPECDVLIHSGDFSRWRGDLKELMEFLVWLEKQPAKKKIWTAGNHDLVLDKNEAEKERSTGNIYGWSKHLDAYGSALELINNYDVKYLHDTDYVYEGVKFYGSPYSPSFHRERWAFNADRGAEIRSIWGRIPKDVDVLITHSPVYGIFDHLKEYAVDGEDPHVGCKDLYNMIKNKLTKLKLHCSGHIHDNVGISLERVSNTRRVTFSNGAALTNKGVLVYPKPMIITI